jgi:signal transduction histidine kinase/CheY-like chemotaxis protein
LALFALVSVLSSALPGDDARPVTITDGITLRRMTENELRHRPPVRIRGTVTYADPNFRDFFLHDDQTGLYVSATACDIRVAPGDRVIVVGRGDPGDFAPCVIASSVERIGTAPLPEPIPFDLNQDHSRWMDGQYVTVVGELHSTFVKGKRCMARLGSSRTEALLIFPEAGAAAELRTLLGRPVVLHGVCVPKFDASRAVVGPPRIYVTSPDRLRTLGQRGDSLVAPQQLAIAELRQFVPLPFAGSRRVRVEGTVVAKDGDRIFVQDGDAGMTVTTKLDTTSIAIGHRVRVNGLLEISGAVCQVSNSSLMELGPAPMPECRVVDADDLVRGDCNGTRVRVRGVVRAVNPPELRRPAILLETGVGRVVAWHAMTAVEVGRFPIGSTVDLAGTAVKFGPWGPNDCGLLLDRAADATLVHLPPEPPFWDRTRLAMVGLALAGAGTFAAAWVSMLRRALRRQKSLLRDKAAREVELAEKLQQSQKMEAVGRLAGGIAHDFNNLLTVINGAAEILPEIMQDDPLAARSLAGDIRGAGTKAAGLVAQLLTFSRQRPTQLAPIALNDIVLDCEKLLRRVIGEDVKVFTIRGDDLPPILGEPVLLHQLIVNLAVNSRDAMPKGGTVTIATRKMTTDDGRELVRLSVADSGCGMPPEVRDRIFEPFFTTKPVGQGTGLGLATVYGVVQTLGATIRVESEVNVGTTFDIDFPAAERPSVPSTTELPTISRIMKLHATKRVLLVEDDDAVRTLTQKILERDGYPVTTADGPDLALELLAENDYDLLVTDVVMPGMGGRELADLARERRPELKILFVSGYTADEVLRRGVQEDDVDFLNKPFTSAQLSEKVGTILTRKAKPGTRSSTLLRNPSRLVPV